MYLEKNAAPNLREFYAKLMAFLLISGLLFPHTGTYTISFLEHMLSPQVKSRLMINILCSSKLGCLDFLLQM